MNFNQIVAIAAPEYGRQPELRLCPDQYVGRLSQVINQADFPVRLAVNERPDSPCLIMVMESPHTHEFNEPVEGPGPAKGDTGKYLRLHLTDAIDCTGRQAVGLILVNPIQYQCSLGESTELYRDKVFHAVWANGGRQEFMDRLLSTFEPGDILMNCCTWGTNGESGAPLRHLVEDAIREALPVVDSIKRTHPFSWKYAENRGKAWYY